MDEWFAKLSESEMLCSVDSGVFKRVPDTRGSPTSFSAFHGYECRMCNNNPKHIKTRDECAVHVNDPIHVQRAQTLVSNRDAKIERFRETLRFDKDLHDFGRPAEIESMICRYVFQGGIKLDSIEKISKDFRRSEPLVLLELVLWKTACMFYPPSPLVDPLANAMWFSRDWKSSKKAMRRHQMICIVPLVAPFLGLKKKLKNEISEF
jgi:hypothetical protein